MIGWLRAALALVLFALAAPPLCLYQYLALRTGYLDPGRAPRALCRIIVRLLGIRVRLSGEPATVRPLLLVANHVSWTDIMVLGSVAELSFIAKAEVAGWPLFGTFARLHRSVFVDRTARRAAGAQVKAVAQRLAAGDALVLFAEGTSADGNRILPFRSTLLQAAAPNPEHPLAVQPVALAYTRLHGMALGRQHRPHAAWIGDQTLMPHLMALLREGAMDVEVHFAAPIDVAPGTSRKQLARQAQGQVRAMLARALRRPMK